MKAVAIALAAGMLCVASFRNAQAASPADIRLVDQRGTTFTLHELRGRPIVISFISTRCADACPVTDAVFAQLARERSGAQLVTVTIDPRYARDLHAPAPIWRVASGRPADVDALLDTFGVQRAATDVHSTLVYCLDARGRLARTLLLSTGTAADVRAWLAGIRHADNRDVVKRL